MNVLREEERERLGIPLSMETAIIETVTGKGVLPMTEKAEVVIGKQSSQMKFAVSPSLTMPNLLNAKQFNRLFNDSTAKYVGLAKQTYEDLRQVTAEKYAEQPSLTVNGDYSPKGKYEQHLEGFNKRTVHLAEHDRNLLWSVLQSYKEVWLQPKIGQVDYEVKLEVDGKPYKARLRHMESSHREELKAQVDQQLLLRVIRPSKSEWAAHPHFVPKKTGELRCVLDYRKLNQALVSDAYPLPLIWDDSRSCAGYQFYITLDLSNGFWNIPLAECLNPIAQ